jgi:hypothetical protein
MARYRSTIARLERALLARALRREIVLAKLAAGLAAESRTIDLHADAAGVWRI